MHTELSRAIESLAHAIEEAVTAWTHAQKRTLTPEERKILDALLARAARILILGNNNPVPLRDQNKDNPMANSPIQDFGVSMNAFFDQFEGEIQVLLDDITKLQTSPGPITPEDQATLDGLQTRVKALLEKAKNPPTVPSA